MTSARDPFQPREKKPGHCENCRCKFEDFDEHTRSRRHRKFAMDENNFVALDELLQRVQREPIEHGSWDDYAPMYQQDQSVSTSVLDEDLDLSTDWVQDTGVEHGAEYVAGSDIDGEPLHELQDCEAPILPDLFDTSSAPNCHLDGTLRDPTTTMNHDNSINGSTETSRRGQHRSQRDECHDDVQPIPTDYEISTNHDIKSNPSVCTVLDDLGKDQDSSTKDVPLSHFRTGVERVERMNSTESESQMESKDLITTSAATGISTNTAASVPAVTVTCISSDPASVTAPVTAPVTSSVTTSVGASVAAPVPTDTAIHDSRNIPSMVVPQPLKDTDWEASQDPGHDAEDCKAVIEHKICPKVDESVSNCEHPNDTELIDSRLIDMVEHQHGSSLLG